MLFFQAHYLASCRSAYDLVSHYFDRLRSEHNLPADSDLARRVQDAKARLTDLENRLKTKEKDLYGDER